jgi:hypothetical protein
MIKYAITETPDDPSLNTHAIIAAEDAYAALAEYSLSQGFADPRAYNGHSEEDFFYVREDGLVGMVFTNTELTAVPTEDGSDPHDYRKGDR